ncbi:MAG: hypothetical protein R3C11_03715 [Planctomycetaceae bacterium]
MKITFLNAGRLLGCTLVGALIALSSTHLNAQQPAPPRPAGAANGNIIQLNRGPIHEAFAQPYQLANSQGLVVNEQPPARIQEQPSSVVPESGDYEWIPGYWGWEIEEQRYIWISGIWRRAPQEMNWNPGYWAQVDGGYAWVAGFWGNDEQSFLVSQTPPEAKEEERGESPSSSQFWVPGHWELVGNDYEWVEGYWAEGYEGHVWVPFRYVWTPRGYIALTGYWDYDLENRGVLFSPVVFQQDVTPDYQYTPSLVVRVDYLPTHMFVDNHYSHYAYGDYYAYGSSRQSFYPWVADNRYYDPLRIFFWTFHRDRFDHYHNRHAYYHDHADYRPRHTWNDQRTFIQQNNNVDLEDVAIAAGVDMLTQGRYPGVQVNFTEDADRRERFTSETKDLQNAQEIREEQLTQLEKTSEETKEKFENNRKEFRKNAEDKAQDTVREADKRREQLESGAGSAASSTKSKLNSKADSKTSKPESTSKDKPEKSTKPEKSDSSTKPKADNKPEKGTNSPSSKSDKPGLNKPSDTPKPAGTDKPGVSSSNKPETVGTS